MNKNKNKPLKKYRAVVLEVREIMAEVEATSKAEAKELIEIKEEFTVIDCYDTFDKPDYVVKLMEEVIV